MNTQARTDTDALPDALAHLDVGDTVQVRYETPAGTERAHGVEITGKDARAVYVYDALGRKGWIGLHAGRICFKAWPRGRDRGTLGGTTARPLKRLGNTNPNREGSA